MDVAAAAQPVARILAGVPMHNANLYHRIRFSVVDVAVWLELPQQAGPPQTLLICRDIELDRARQQARVDRVACPADFAPAGGLSGDREVATAQAAAECLRRAGIRQVVADRSLPLLFAEVIQQAGIEVLCDPQFGVLERRRKDPQELAWIQEAQRVTEQAVALACRMIASAKAGPDGVLWQDGQVLSSERVRAAIDHFLLDQGYLNTTAIVAGGTQGADCHESGSGPLRTGEPIIIDVFPRNRQTLYHGDCTRTIVHGNCPPPVRRMHQAVVEAKAAAMQAAKAGITGQQVHRQAAEVLHRWGYHVGPPNQNCPPKTAFMPHGTGHGLGLEVHESPLLDQNGPPLLAGDVVSIEPGLYLPGLGGVRVEDLVVITEEGCQNLNSLPDDLEWKESV
ncbi:MAG: Xaa-Pro peptidase family protein [Thermoguttaceae bacterium]|nr:Xaa-Pro peptidase family protein [Thermoguttaceae bacterium]MDW8036896.1 Xaa-Pro peptidase family protein [Thermoguttaceae bacterium]